MSKLYVAKGDWVIVNGNYYKAKRGCTMDDKAFSATHLELKTKKEYDEWLKSIPWWQRLLGVGATMTNPSEQSIEEALDAMPEAELNAYEVMSMSKDDVLRFPLTDMQRLYVKQLVDKATREAIIEELGAMLVPKYKNEAIKQRIEELSNKEGE